MAKKKTSVAVKRERVSKPAHLSKVEEYKKAHGRRKKVEVSAHERVFIRYGDTTVGRIRRILVLEDAVMSLCRHRDERGMSYNDHLVEDLIGTLQDSFKPVKKKR